MLNKLAESPTLNEKSELQSSEIFDKSRFTVLVVDDEPSMRDLLKLIIEDAGLNVLVAENGDIGAEIAIEKSPSLIISDIRMPVMNGIEMIDKIHSQNIDIPIIFMTGYTDYESLVSTIQFQPLGFLHKPFGPEQLVALVNRAFDLKTAELDRSQYKIQLEEGIATKTRQLEFKSERLRVEKKLLRGIVSQANFGLVALDMDFSVHLINDLAIKLLQVPEDSMGYTIGSHFKETVSPQFHSFLENQITTVSDTGKIVENDYWDEELRQRINIVTYAIRHARQITAFVFIIHDVTEKDSLQKRLNQTAKLASLGELAAGVAHEINNPLGFVNSNCNTLREYFSSIVEYSKKLEECCSPEKNEKLTDGKFLNELREQYDVSFIEEDGLSLLNETVEGLERVSKIVIDLKSFARVDSDLLEQADINELIEDALNLVRNETKYKLTIEKQLADLPTIFCLPGQLVQVFTNLFINASHAVEEKGTLTITSKITDNQVVLTISDTGSGISEANLPVIFDPFFTTKETGKGTGMGLSISYGIIEKHSGSISVVSEIGKETTFTIKLPANLRQPDQGDCARNEETNA